MSTDEKQNFIIHEGRTLHKNGYTITPIKPRSKEPTSDEWQKRKQSDRAVERWANVPKIGVGIVTGKVAGIDIDSTNAELVEDFINECVFTWGVAPERLGNAPKTLLLYRITEPQQKRSSAKFYKETVKDPKHQLEVLGKGQQFVAFGIHPDTGEEYKWSERSALDYKLDELPAIGPADIDLMVELFEQLAKKYGLLSAEEIKQRDRDAQLNDSAFAGLAHVKPPLDISEDYIEQILDVLPADDYDEWLEVGMALHHQYSGDDQGLQRWHEWSKQSDKYEAEVLEAKWVGFATLRGSIKTFATLIDRARVKLIGKDPLAGMLKRYAYLAEGDMVIDLRQLPHFGMRKLTEFKTLMANVRVKIGSGKQQKIKEVSSLWLVHPQRKTAERRIYRPGSDRLVADHEQLCYNTFAFPRHDKSKRSKAGLTLFMNHLKYLLPNEKERHWFIGWIAHIIQYPHIRPQTTPLHIAQLHGTGRGLVTKLLRRLVGPWNCSSTTIEDLIDGQFNEYLYETLLVFIGETKEPGSKQFEVDDKIRDKLTESYLTINKKHGQKGVSEVFSRIFMMSNHYDALRIPPEDRRINVFDGPIKLQPASHYDKLVEAIEDDQAVSALFYWLAKFDLSSWDMRRSMNTPGRQRMISYGRNDTEQAFFDLLDHPPRPIMSREEICRELENLVGDDDSMETVSHKQVTKLLQQQCRSLGKVRLGQGKRPWLWELKRTDKQYSNKEIKALLSDKQRSDTVVSIDKGKQR